MTPASICILRLEQIEAGVITVPQITSQQLMENHLRRVVRNAPSGSKLIPRILALSQPAPQRTESQRTACFALRPPNPFVPRFLANLTALLPSAGFVTGHVTPCDGKCYGSDPKNTQYPCRL